MDKVVELVGGGSVINPVYFLKYYHNSVADFSNVATAIATGAGVALGDSVALPKQANRVDRHMMAGKEGVARGGSLGGGS